MFLLVVLGIQWDLELVLVVLDPGVGQTLTTRLRRLLEHIKGRPHHPLTKGILYQRGRADPPRVCADCWNTLKGDFIVRNKGNIITTTPPLPKLLEHLKGRSSQCMCIVYCLWENMRRLVCVDCCIILKAEFSKVFFMEYYDNRYLNPCIGLL